MKFVTALITVYNSEKYLSKIFESLLCQTNKNFSVLICDDGSTDNSKRIIEQYIKKFTDNDIECKCIYQTNQGVSAAVNTLLPFIDTEYFFVCDSDDWLSPDSISALYEHVENNQQDFDVLLFSANYFDENYNFLYKKSSKLLKGTDIFKESIIGIRLPSFAGSNIYKTESFLKFNKSNQIFNNLHNLLQKIIRDYYSMLKTSFVYKYSVKDY